jgi:hypothetical protein
VTFEDARLPELDVGAYERLSVYGQEPVALGQPAAEVRGRVSLDSRNHCLSALVQSKLPADHRT